MPDNHSDLFRSYLETSDLEGIRKLWHHVAPHLPQPKGDFEVQVMMHAARTQAASIAPRLRYYSHQWLLANGLPSPLPEHLKPAAERMDFKFAFGVGIRVKATDPQKKPMAEAIERAMDLAVREAFADGRTDTVHLSRRMTEARDRTIRQFGRPQITVSVGFKPPGMGPRV